MIDHAVTDPSAGGQAADRDNRPAVQSLVLGLVSIPAAFAFGVGALLGIAAVVLGVRGIRIAREGGGRKRSAVIGIVGGTIGFLLVLLYVLDQAGL
jgi:hypothetical protein